MVKFEVGKTYIAYDSLDCNKTLPFTVLSRTEKRLRIQTSEGKKTVPFFENAFGESEELCYVKGYRLVSASWEA